MWMLIDYISAIFFVHHFMNVSYWNVVIANYHLSKNSILQL